jgi:predicted small lipoprotein YifL
MRYILALMACAAALSACDSRAPQLPPPSDPTRVPAQTQQTHPQQQTTTTLSPEARALADEFDREANSARGAWQLYGRDRSAEAFARAGTHIHNALRLRIAFEDMNYDVSILRGGSELNRLRMDWSKTNGPSGWKDDPAYQAAFEAYQAAQQGR